MTLRRAISLLAHGLCLVTLLGCEVRTSARLGSGPSFSLGGSGRLVSFAIWGPQPGHKIATPNDAKSLVWSIQPSGGYPDSVPVAHVNLVYGSVPERYTQTVPSRGPVPALTAGLVYYFFAETNGAPGKDGFFYMDKTTPILIRVPDLCESGFTGDVKPLKCGTKEPYVEPEDLEQFVRENRVDE
jgi:hypothetical protein